MPQFSSSQSRICEYSTLGFAVWTLTSNLTALTNGGLLDLLASFGALGLLGIFLSWSYTRRQWNDHASQSLTVQPLDDSAQRLHTRVLWGLVVVAVGLTLVAHRPDGDDVTYVNRAVAAADNPHAPILQYDAKHSTPGPMRRITKMQSLEMLAAALSWGSGIPAIYWFHLVFPAVAAMLAVLAYGELFRLLAPQHWSWGVLAVMVFLCADGEVHRTYGNFSFVRLHQGKGILVSVIVPLIIAYSLRFVSRPSGRNWLLLSSIQIAAIGVSSTGLMVAPVVAACSLLAGIFDLPTTTQRVRRLLLGCAASGYILLRLAFGLPHMIDRVIRIHTSPALQQHFASAFGQSAEMLVSNAYFALVSLVIIVAARYWCETWTARCLCLIFPLAIRLLFANQSAELVFGNGYFAIVSLVIIVTAWYWCETWTARCLCLIFPLAVGLFFANPIFAPLIAICTGPGVYWRVFWLLPLPIMAGLTFLAPLTSTPSWPYWRQTPKRKPPGQHDMAGKLMRYATYVLLLLLLLGGASERTIFAKENRVRLAEPGLKVPPGYQIAQFINDVLDDRPNVLVPEVISIWLPTLHHHPYPLVSRFFGSAVLGKERVARVALKRYIMGLERSDNAPYVFHDAIQHYAIAAVGIPPHNPWAAEIRQVLNGLDFVKCRELLSHEIWLAHRPSELARCVQDQ